MAAPQGSLELLNDPVAQDLLHGPYPAHLSYVWKDGSARVVPIGFHWNGSELVMAGPDNAPKNQVIDGQNVTVVIDTYTFPFKVLTLRGKVRLETVKEPPIEYVLACEQLMGKETAALWLQNLGPLLPKIDAFVKVIFTPEWVRITDFVTRFPEAVEEVMQKV